MQGAPDFEQGIAIGRDAGAVAVDVDLDPDLEGLAMFLAEAGDRLGTGDVERTSRRLL